MNSLPRYTGATGLRREAVARMTDNSGKWVIRHVSTGLYLLVDEGNVDAYVAGDRNSATGFPSERSALKAGERYGLNGQGFVIEKPTKNQ